MDFSNWNPDLIPGLMDEVAVLEKNSTRELAMRIISAFHVQDSCKKCWIRTMRTQLISGQDGLYTCDECTDEIMKRQQCNKTDRSTSAQKEKE